MKNTLLKTCASFILIIVTFSCAEEVEFDLANSDNLFPDEKYNPEGLLENENRTILPLDSSDFPKSEKTIFNQLNSSVFNHLYQLEGMTFFIQPKVSYLSNNTFQTDGLGRELTIKPQVAGRASQLFYFQFLPPSSGISYLIRSFALNEVIGAGSYSNNPDNYVLYTRSPGSSSLFGFSWDFYLNNNQDGFIIENRDILGSGPGGPWDIYNYALQAQSGNISFVRRNNSSIYQQFNIIPNDEFTIQSVNLDFNNAMIVGTNPYFLRSGSISNDGSTTITRNLSMTESQSEMSNFKETNGITTNKTGSLNIGLSLFDVVEIGGGYTVQRGRNQTIEYGASSNRTISVTESFTIPVPPRTFVSYRFVATRHRVNIGYTAELFGVNSNNTIEVSGMYSGVDYSSTYLEVTERPIDGGIIGGRFGKIKRYRIYPNPRR